MKWARTCKKDWHPDWHFLKWNHWTKSKAQAGKVVTKSVRSGEIVKEASTERGRGLLLCFPRLCIRKVVFFTPWPPHSPFLGKSETKSREAAAGRERRTGKLALGRRGVAVGRAGTPEPTQHEWQRKKPRRLSGTHAQAHRHKNVKHTCMLSSPLVSRPFYPLWPSKNVPWEYFGCTFSWNAELMPGSSALQPASAVNPMLWLLCHAC